MAYGSDSQSVHHFGLKYFNTYWIDCHAISCRYSRSLEEKFELLWWSHALAYNLFIQYYIMEASFFSVFIHSVALGMIMSFSWSTTLAGTEISQQQLDGFCTDIHGPQRMKPIWRYRDFSFGTTSRLSFLVLKRHNSTSTEWIGLNFCADIHGSPMMNPNDFGDPLTFSFVPPSGQN